MGRRQLKSRSFSFASTPEGISDGAQILYELLRDGGTQAGKVITTKEEIEQKLNRLNTWSNRDENGEPRRDFGDCKCTHPPSFGHCIFGACVSVFKYGLKITINI